MDRNGFYVGIAIGVIVVTALLASTPLYKGWVCVFDNQDILDIIEDGVSKPVNHFLYKEWSWEPYKSGFANFLVSILHVIAIAIIVPMELALCIFYALIFPMIFAVGAFLGALVGVITSPIIYIGCAGWHVPGPAFSKLVKVTAIGGSVFMNYVTHVLIIALFYGWYVATFKRFVEWAGLGGETEMKYTEYPTKALVNSNLQNLMPQSNFLTNLQRDLAKYPPDMGLVSMLFPWIDRRKYDIHNSILNKQCLTINQIARCLTALYSVVEAYSRLKNFEKEEAIRVAKLDLEMLEVQQEIEMKRIDHQLEIEAKYLKHNLNITGIQLELLQKLRQQAEVFIGKDDKEEYKDEKMREIEKMRDRFLYLQDILGEIKNRYGDDPEKAAIMVDRFMRDLIEEGVIANVDDVWAASGQGVR